MLRGPGAGPGASIIPAPRLPFPPGNLLGGSVPVHTCPALPGALTEVNWAPKIGTETLPASLRGFLSAHLLSIFSI